MKRYKAVIFDLDDTLYCEKDYVLSGFSCVSKYLSNVIEKSKSELFNELISLFKMNKKNVFNRILINNDIENEGILEKCISTYRNHCPNIKLSKEAKYIIKWLKKREFKLGIITDGRPDGQWNKINALNIKDLFDYIIITDELGGIEFRKPNSIAYKKMIQKLQIKPEEAIYVGDNVLKDFYAANQLGIITIFYQNKDGLYNFTDYQDNNDYTACYTISSLKGIKKIVNICFDE